MSSKKKCVDAEKLESKRLFLEAILAEYDRLNKEILTHQKSIVLVFSVMVAGLATLLGVTGVIGVLSLLIAPIFVSFCGAAVFQADFSVSIIGEYIDEEIEQGKLLRLFPNGSPIQWEGKVRSQYRSFTDYYLKGIFILSFLGCIGCSIAALLFFWNDVFSNIIYILISISGWIMLGFYTMVALRLFKQRRG